MAETLEPMATFDPSQPLLMHDLLNDETFVWRPEWRESYRQHAVASHLPGVMEWDGLQLDGWLKRRGYASDDKTQKT